MHLPSAIKRIKAVGAGDLQQDQGPRSARAHQTRSYHQPTPNTSTSSSSTAPSPKSLLDLPYEIRREIYHYLIPHKNIYEVSYNVRLWSENQSQSQSRPSSPRHRRSYTRGFEIKQEKQNETKNPNSIFCLSRRISEEALDILYGENIFMINLYWKGLVDFRKNITEANGRRMRDVLLVSRPGERPTWTDTPRLIPENAVWPSILPMLRRLRITVEHPTPTPTLEKSDPFQALVLDQDSLSYTAPLGRLSRSSSIASTASLSSISSESSIESSSSIASSISSASDRDVQRWYTWVRPFVIYLSQYLTQETTVLVDMDDQAEVRELFTQCLPHGFREGPCPYSGHVVFQRRVSEDVYS